jgi:hypothetical protein
MRHFTHGTLSRVLDFTRGRVRSIAELYIPYRLYRVTIVSSGREQGRAFALDAVQGTLDLFEFPKIPREGEWMNVETRNVIPATLDEALAREQIIAKIRRMIFTRGFFKVRDLWIQAEPIAGEICIPYWIGFRGQDERVSISVFDAVRRRPEGAKVRRLVEEWLRER